MLRRRLFLPGWQTIRHFPKLNVRKPPPGPWPRRIMEEVTKPILFNRWSKDSVRCEEERSKVQNALTEVNLYEEFLVRKCKEMFVEKRMILVFQSLPALTEEIRLMRNKFIKAGMDMIQFNNQVMRKAVDGTRYINMAALFHGTNRYVVSNDIRITDAVKISKKIPHLILVGGLVDDCLYSRHALMDLAKLSSLDSIRANILSILHTPATSIVNSTTYQHSLLTLYLQEYIKEYS